MLFSSPVAEICALDAKKSSLIETILLTSFVLVDKLKKNNIFFLVTDSFLEAGLQSKLEKGEISDTYPVVLAVI